MNCKSFLRYTEYSLKAAGTMQISKHSSLFSLHKIWSYLSQLYFVLYCISSTVGMKDFGNIEDEQKLNENITLILAILPLLFKLALAHTTGIRNMITKVYEFESRLNRDNHEIIRLYDRNASNNYKIFSLYTFLDTATAISYFFIGVENWMRRSHQLIYSGWFPYDSDEYLGVSYLFQLCGPPLGAIYSVAFDTLFITLMNVATARLYILGYKLKHLGKYSASRKESPSTCLGNIVMEHQSVIGYVKSLSDCLKLYFLLDSLVKSFTISSLLIMFIHAEKTDIPLRISYLMYVLFQVCGLYYLASKISFESTQLCGDIFESNWYDQSAEVKRSLLILMTRVQKPLVLTIGNLREINNGLMIKFLKACYTLVLSCLQLGI